MKTPSPRDPPAGERWALSLARIAAEQDREAFAEVFSHFGPKVKSFLLRRGFPDGQAEDLAQDALIAVWRKAAQFDPEVASAATWIFAIARNLLIDAKRREGRAILEDLTDIEADYEIDPTPLGDEALVAAERDRQVRAALESLPEQQRQAIRMSYFEDRPHTEIAETLGIPLGTVKSRLRLAMQRLRDALEETRP